MSNAVIGALRVVLGIDTAAFEDGLSKAQKELARAGAGLQKIGRQMESVGARLSVGLTVPLVAMGAGALKASADFEAAMIKVSISTKATAGEMQQLQKSAQEIGKATIFSATDAADAMDMLAKTGLDTATILNGAAKATVDLAAATGSELEPAASAVSDTLQQFKLPAAQLPKIVDQITGAVNQSKLEFADYSLAIGQAGGVAAGLGVSLQDFNATIAGTSSLFSSGSDAGTSFKTFLTSLVPTTKKAAGLMEQYGLKFFDAQGRMKSMAEIAEMLRTKLGGLSDEAKNDVLKTLFGADAMRTAIGLMKLGAAGVEDLKKKIADTNAQKQAEARMEGFNGQLDKLKGSLEQLAITIGQSGLLNVMTGIVQAVGKFVDVLSKANPAILKLVVVLGAVAAAVGPIVLVAGALVSAWGAVVAAVGPVIAVTGALVSALLPILLPIVAAVAAVGLAFYVFRDDILPILKAFWDRAVQVLGPSLKQLFDAVGQVVGALGDAFKTFAEVTAGGALGEFFKLYTSVLGESLIRVLNAALQIVTTTFQQIANVIRLVTAVLSGDWKGAWEAAFSIVKTMVDGALRVVDALFPGVRDAVMKTAQAVKTWLQDRLGATFEWLRQEVRAVGDFFLELYDRVVGHSYIPDLVEGVAEWMAKLDAGMVTPAKNATKKTKEAFEDLRDDLARVMEGVLTDQERFSRELRNNAAVLAEGLKTGQITPFEAAQTAHRYELRRPAPESTVFNPTGMETTGEAMSRIGESLGRAGGQLGAMQKQMQDMFGDAFYDGIQTLLHGGSLGKSVKSFFHTIGEQAAQNIANMLSNALSRAITGGLGNLFSGLGGGAGGGIGGFLGGLFRAAPGFARGGSFMVGGRAGLDKNLVMMRASRDERVTVETPWQQRQNDVMGRGGNTFNFSFPGIANERDARIATKVAAARFQNVIAMAARQSIAR